MPSLFRLSNRRKEADRGPALPASVERDRTLLDGAREGDPTAVDELYRLHRSVAQGVARGLCRHDDVDDVVAEAFTRVLDQIAQGRGPRVSFRAYLITAVRSAATDLARKDARLVWTDDVDGAAPDVPVRDDARPDSPVRHESALLTQALDGLPPRWQLVLWWTTVERRALAEVGELLDISANAAAALAFRAREGLRDAYLRLHVPPADEPACATFRADLVAAVRARSDRAPLPGVTGHLDSCRSCHDVASDLWDARATVAAGS